MRENTDQKNSDYERFLRSVTDTLSIKYVMNQDWPGKAKNIQMSTFLIKVKVVYYIIFDTRNYIATPNGLQLRLLNLISPVVFLKLCFLERV